MRARGEGLTDSFPGRALPQEVFPDLRARVRNALVRSGYVTRRQVVEATDAELRMLPNIGASGLEHLREALPFRRYRGVPLLLRVKAAWVGFWNPGRVREL